MNHLVGLEYFGYFGVLPVLVTKVFVWDYCGWRPSDTDLSGIFEFGLPWLFMMIIHAASSKHWVFVFALIAAEAWFFITVHQRNAAAQDAEKARVEKLEAAFQLEQYEERKAFAARVALPPNDPRIDEAYSHITDAGRDAIQNQEDLSHMLAEYTGNRDKQQRRKRFFYE